MSSWISDWGAVMPKASGEQASIRSQCKVGRHALYKGDPAVWLRGKYVGLSCVPCAERVAPEVIAQERERAARPATIPGPRRGGRVDLNDPSTWQHGKATTYASPRKCRCPECCAANTRQARQYRARVAARKSRGVL